MRIFPCTQNHIDLKKILIESACVQIDTKKTRTTIKLVPLLHQQGCIALRTLQSICTPPLDMKRHVVEKPLAGPVILARSPFAGFIVIIGLCHRAYWTILSPEFSSDISNQWRNSSLIIFSPFDIFSMLQDADPNNARPMRLLPISYARTSITTARFCSGFHLGMVHEICASPLGLPFCKDVFNPIEH